MKRRSRAASRASRSRRSQDSAAPAKCSFDRKHRDAPVLKRKSQVTNRLTRIAPRETMRLVIAGLGMVVSVEWEDIDKVESVKRQINRREA